MIKMLHHCCQKLWAVPVFSLQSETMNCSSVFIAVRDSGLFQCFDCRQGFCCMNDFEGCTSHVRAECRTSVERIFLPRRPELHCMRGGGESMSPVLCSGYLQ